MPAFMQFLLLLMLPLARAQIYLPCDEDDMVNLEGCTCWNPQNPIISCASLGLKKLPNVTKAHTLNLNNNRLTYIDENDFKQLVGLRRLTLSNNLISEFSFRAFNHEMARGLELFDLTHNMLEEIPSIFSGYVFYFEGDTMANLTVLKLSYNYIGLIKKGAFRGAPNLQELYLDGNPVTRIAPYAWRRMLSVLHLEISTGGMDLLTIPTRGIERLTSLRLEGVRPRKLDTMSPWFEAFSSLQYLTLEGMGLRDGHFYTGRFPSAWSTSLLGISLAGNELTAIPYQILSLTHLQELDVSRNGIDRIEEAQAQLQVPTQIRRFNASGNILTHIDSQQLLHLTNAKVIDISNNRLSHMDFTLQQIQRHLPTDVVIYVGGNPWSCGWCYNKWLSEFAGSRHLTEYERLNTFRCGPGGSNSGDLIKDVPVSKGCRN